MGRGPTKGASDYRPGSGCAQDPHTGNAGAAARCGWVGDVSSTENSRRAAGTRARLASKRIAAAARGLQIERFSSVVATYP